MKIWHRIEKPTPLTPDQIESFIANPAPPLQVIPDGAAELLSLLDIQYQWDNYHQVWYFSKGIHSWRMHPEYLRTWEDWTRAVDEIRVKLLDLEHFQ